MDTAAANQGAAVSLAFSTLGCGQLELTEVLDLAKRRSLPAVELRTLGGSTDILEYFRHRFGSPDRLRSLLDTGDIEIVSIDTSVNAIDASTDDQTMLIELMPWVAAAGARRIRVFDGGTSGDDSEIARAIELVDWWEVKKNGEGWQADLVIETHDALAQPGALQRFLDRSPNGQILWDTHHTWKDGGEAPARTMERLRGRTTHLHVKDSVRTSVGGGFRYVPPGEGEFLFSELIEAIESACFGGIISLEWERHWYPELPSLEIALDGFQRTLSMFSSASADAQQP
ncbi:MAG: TIM barrel protein [Devosia sp.]